MKHSLPRRSPESQGIPSAAVIRLLDGFAARGLNMHSLMLVRHGQVTAEGWWQPYAADCRRYLYSLSKSFTSTAVGFAVAEGLLTVEDKVVSFFPAELPRDAAGAPALSGNLAAMRVKDLLTMTTGHEQDSTPVIMQPGFESWVQAILSLPVERQPGTLFVYNSGASYLLSAIVQKVTGQTVMEYLTPRLFAPLGIEKAVWETSPQGINTGGWGLSVKTEDVAKFGLLYAQNGAWHGQQLLPADWVAEATAAVVPNGGEGREDAPTDWRQGYGYQFWRCQHNAYRGDGAFGQYCVVMPDQDAVLVMTSETGDMQAVMDLVWQHLLPAMQAQALPEDPAAQVQLAQRLSGLALPTPPTGTPPMPVTHISGRTYRLNANPYRLKTLAIDFSDSGCVLTLAVGSKLHQLHCGHGQWIAGKTRLPFLEATMVQPGPLRHTVRVAAAGGWATDGSYAIHLRFLETPHGEHFTLHFAGDQVQMSVRSSMVPPDHPTAEQAERRWQGTAD